MQSDTATARICSLCPFPPAIYASRGNASGARFTICRSRGWSWWGRHLLCDRWMFGVRLDVSRWCPSRETSSEDKRGEQTGGNARNKLLRQSFAWQCTEVYI